eukprot:4910804-Amphidinium_carterae.1
MHKLGVTLTTAPSYQPQSNGMAERCVGLMKTAGRRLGMSCNLVDRYCGPMRFTLQPNSKKPKPWDIPGINLCLVNLSPLGDLCPRMDSRLQ